MLRGSEGELAHAARLGTPRGCTAGRGQGTGRGDKGRDPDRPAPSRSACREPLGQQESQNSQTYISAQSLPSSPLALPSLQESSVPAPRLRGQPSSLRCHCQGPADPSLWWDTGTRPRSRQGQGWERSPGVLTRAVHLPPVTLWDTGTRRPRGRLGGHPPRAPHPRAQGMAPGTPRSPGRAGGAPSLPPSRGTAAAGISYLGLVEDEPDEGGDQQGAGHGGAGPQLLVKVGERGGLLGQRHRVRVPHGGPGGQRRTAGSGGGRRGAGGQRPGCPGPGPAAAGGAGSASEPPVPGVRGRGRGRLRG